MLERFREYINRSKLCQDGDRILVAVSGGIDSVVLLDLFVQAGFETGLAHCNFHLRGKESDEEAEFASSLARGYSIPFYRADFETGKYAEKEKISIQMAARNLRYDWFEETRQEEGFDYIATAHNGDDVLETFFINLSRGTGIRGLSGIPQKSGRVIRPLLFASRDDITDYANLRGIAYREDSSNASDKYLRNKIRHKLLPLLEEQNPSFRKSLSETISRLSETEKVFRLEMEKLKKGLVIQKKDRVLIPVEELLSLGSRQTILYEILADYDFGPAMVDDISHSLEGSPGKQFFSSSHRLVRDRRDLIITPIQEHDDRKYYLELEDGQVFDPIDLEWIPIDKTENFDIPKDPAIACLDLDLLSFPLILRHWKAGDYFKPFGMKGLKKISDFLIDQKVSRPDKENTWLLTSGQKIVWVVGHRIDEDFRITDRTEKVLMMKFLSRPE
jgi:tRNA(Ile)-lysidine synthase